MGLDDSSRGGITWVKKTKFTKTTACLFIYHHLLLDGKIKRDLVEYALELDNRVTIYNYIGEIKIFISEFKFFLGQEIEVYYDIDTKEYILDLRKKK
ncbi:MAG: hypothetical protein K2N64_07570 [Anaeroplasmataceae bacterium]|nr:hypothetical protein [Anaeroplasmataceae bacterium]